MTTTPEAMRAADPVRRLLGRIRREARAWIWVESLASVALAAAAAVGLTLAIDWLFEPPAWVRAALVTAAAACLGAVVVMRLFVRLGTPLGDRTLALAVERRHPELGDTLSTAVGLAAAPPAEVDPALVARTTAAAGELVGQVDPRRVFRRGRLVLAAAAGAAAAAGLAGFVAARPELAALWGRRMLLLADEPWPRRVRLEAEGFRDSVRLVARGSDVELVVRAAAATGPPPEQVDLRIRGRDGWRTVRMGTRGGVTGDGQRFGHLLEGMGEDLELELRGGDARLRGLRLLVVEPPTLAAASVMYALPEYLGGGERRPPFSRVVPVPRGSRVRLALTTSKPLATARLTGRVGSVDQASRATGEPAAGRDPAAASSLLLLAERLPSDPPGDTIDVEIPALDADLAITLEGTDTDGIQPREPFRLSLTAVADQPPSLALRLADISGAVAPGARLPITGTLADDHGLADARVELARGDDTWSLPIARIRGGEPLVEMPVDRAEVVALGPLSLAAGDRLAVRVSARDRCGLSGGPNEGTSDTWLFDVVTPEAIQAMLEAREILLRRRFEAAIEDLAQARRGLGEEPLEPGEAFGLAVGRLGEAAARAGGEVGEIAAAFRSIRNEFDLNGLLTSELETRLVVQVADPLASLAASGLEGLSPACRAAAAGDLAPTDLAGKADAALAALRSVLARMLELESFNEVIEKLRGVIRTQEQIRADTLERQRRRAREALEAP